MRGESYKRIAKNYRCSNRKILYVVEWIQAGHNYPPPPKYFGRKTTCTTVARNAIKSATKNHPNFSSSDLALQIREDNHVEMSATSVWRMRINLKFVFRAPKKRPKLSQRQIQQRLNFCLKERTGKINWSTSVVITDESRFCLVDDSRRRWLRRGVYSDNNFCSTMKFPPSVMVWAGIGHNFKSPLVFITKSIDAPNYISMLKNNGIIKLIKDSFVEAVFFQQDGAPAHTAKLTKKFLEEEKLKTIDDWPSNSPDLSPIENLWGILKFRVNARRPQTIHELIEFHKDEWEKIDLITINNLMNSIPNRFDLVLKNGGQCISHLLR
jgi:hypothetical protein